MQSTFQAGAAVADLTPTTPCFLYGYPHVPRTSTGVHDPLLASVLVLESGDQACAFVAADVIFISRPSTQRIRRQIAAGTDLRPEAICISATHTHSGPVTLDHLSNEADPVVPRADQAYLEWMEQRIAEAVIRAWQQRRPAEIGLARADATGIGTCRHDPAGPSDLSVPVLLAREAGNGAPIGLMLVCAMHPTVLHEDSTLISGDFPAFTRQYLQQRWLGEACPIIYHTGAAGDQSPRHVTRANTFDEARRLGHLLGAAVERVLEPMQFTSDAPIRVAGRCLDLPARVPPDVQTAQRGVDAARARLEALRQAGAPRQEVRTAECDWFGAEETLAIARAAAEGRLEAALAQSLPAEIQVIAIGPHRFIAWPGEFFVQFALDVRAQYPEAAILTLANGELQGYVVTQEAVDRQWYEAGNALLKSPEAGQQVVAATLELLASLKAHGHD